MIRVQTKFTAAACNVFNSLIFMLFALSGSLYQLTLLASPDSKDMLFFLSAPRAASFEYMTRRREFRQLHSIGWKVLRPNAPADVILVIVSKGRIQDSRDEVT